MGDSMSGVEYGRDALDFIEALEAHGKMPAAMQALELAFGRFGFETIIVAGLPNPDQAFSQMVLAKRWPAEWFRRYTNDNDDRAVIDINHKTLSGLLERIGLPSVIQHSGPRLDAVARANLHAPGSDAERKIA
jgi:Autoinducer binding domain